MPKKIEKSNKNKTIFNYLLNVTIVALAVVCLFLLGSLAVNSFNKSRSEVKRDITDTSNVVVTNQPNLTIQVDVQNGTGESGVASKFTEYLRSKGCDVVEAGNFQFKDTERTYIIDRSGNKNNAKRVALMLGITEKQIIQQINPNLYLDVTIVIGKDFADLKPFKEKSK